jgi:hypothetical protein
LSAVPSSLKDDTVFDILGIAFRVPCRSLLSYVEWYNIFFAVSKFLMVSAQERSSRLRRGRRRRRIPKQRRRNCWSTCCTGNPRSGRTPKHTARRELPCRRESRGSTKRQRREKRGSACRAGTLRG